MRRMTMVLTVGALIPLAGCNTTKWNMFRGKENPPPQQARPFENPTAAALVNYLNDNSDRIKSVRVASLDLQCSQGIRSVGLSGQMVCQKPRNFRMSAKVFGKQEIDLGSNNKEFWYWIARGDPYQFHCSYEALEAGKVRQLPFPFQPDWMMEALGMARYGPADRQVVVKKDTVELVEKTKSPQGRTVRKVTVFRRTPATNGAAQVTAHLLVDDATNKLICSAQINQVQLDRNSGARIPYRVVLYWPEGKIKLSMTLEELTVNGDITNSNVLFARPNMTNIKSFDLAEWKVSSPTSNIQRVEGRMQ
jgi:hypothetical protein